MRGRFRPSRSATFPFPSTPSPGLPLRPHPNQFFTRRKAVPMLRSLYSGISGLRAHQTTLDVTGNNIAQGSSQSTGRATDLMISGDGFFVTSKGGSQLFTRAGAFSPDAANQLV